jgi:hypothetical protein
VGLRRLLGEAAGFATEGRAPRSLTMDKEIIELLKSLAGNAETLVIWYMALDFAKTAIDWCGAIVMAYMFGRGIRGLSAWLDRN